ncbi:hypothetical protein BDQ17DRAFT_1435417 [Cyathus striatus]|nr:hypothetical protein BDQ17DRAFT_1435417 [Cyathus striatus]
MKLTLYVFMLSVFVFMTVHSIPLSVPLQRDLEQPILETRNLSGGSMQELHQQGVVKDGEVDCEEDDAYFDRALDEALLRTREMGRLEPRFIGLLVKAGRAIAGAVSGHRNK